MKAKKRIVKRRTDTRKITVSIPEEVYYNIKQFAKEEIRTISQQARLFIEIGLQVVSQQPEHEECDEPQERESCIGFHVDRSDDDGE